MTGLYQVTSDPRSFSVKITDAMAKKAWDNDANELLQEFRSWLTEVKDAEHNGQAGSDDGGSQARSGVP